MKAIILSIGNEVLSGNTINTNQAFLSRELEALGIDVTKAVVIGDDPEAIKEEVRNFINSEAEILLTTGGLGPTHDDLTKEAVSEELGLKLFENKNAKADMYNYFKETKEDCNIKQSLFPKDAIILKNKLGSADGAIIKYQGKIIILLVGPPYEMVPMFKEELALHLNTLGKSKLIQEFITMGNSESYFENLLFDLFNKYQEVEIAPYASNGVIRYKFISDIIHLKAFNSALGEFKEIMGNYIVSEDGKSVEEVLVESLILKKQTISFAESMTGGLLASKIVNVPNASKVLKESLVTYSNEAKTKHLKVDFKGFESVSISCVKQMANGLASLTGSDINVAVSGYAGPEEKDIGKFFYAIKSEDFLITGEAKFRGNREMIILRATRYILYQTLIFVKEISN